MIKITAYFLIQPEGYNEPRHEVGSQMSGMRISWIKAYCTIQHQTLICCQIINILLCIGWYHRIYCKYSSSPGQKGKTITTKTLKKILCFQNSQLSLKVYYSLLNFYIVNIMVNIVFMWYSLKRCLLAASVMLLPLCNKYLRQLYHNFH